MSCPETSYVISGRICLHQICIVRCMRQRTNTSGELFGLAQSHTERHLPRNPIAFRGQGVIHIQIEWLEFKVH